MFPAVLNILSEAVLVAQMHIYFFANLVIRGYFLWLSRHHIRGSASGASNSSCRYHFSSASARALFGRARAAIWTLLFFSRSHSPFFLGAGGRDEDAYTNTIRKCRIIVIFACYLFYGTTSIQHGIVDKILSNDNKIFKVLGLRG